MDPTILATVGSVIISLIGRAMAEGDYEKARALRQEAIDQYGPEIVPVLDKAEAQEVGATEFGSLKEDDSLRQAQLRALSEFGNVYDSEGMTEADKAAMALARNDVSQRAGSQYQGVAQMMARRGGGGSGLQAAMYGQAGQDATNALANMDMQSQIAARQRALQALGMSADLAGSVRGQDYRALSDRARAQDAINQFNANQRAEASNENARRTMDMANFNLDRLNRRTGALNTQASGYDGSAQRTQQTASGVANSVQSFGEAGTGQRNWDDYLNNKKKGG